MDLFFLLLNPPVLIYLSITELVVPLLVLNTSYLEMEMENVK